MDQSLTEAHRRVLDAIDTQALVDDVVRLVRAPSVTGTDTESELQNDMASRLAELGMNVDLWKFDLDELKADPEYPGIEADRSEGYGVVAVSEGEGEGDPALILQGHIDVVPVGDLAKWAGDGPFSGDIIGDTIFGRGTVDMKAGVAANFAVARALLTSGVKLERGFAIHQVVSEEDGGLGAFATMRRGHRGEVAVITEPTSGRLLTANAGALTFVLRVPGRAAHGSTRMSGMSAFEAFRASAERLSRHWYDLAMLAEHDHGQVAIEDSALLADVVKHKKVFYNASYANYDACLTGQLRLIPEDAVLAALRDDFQRMIGAGMFIGEPPTFDAIVDRLRALEAAINER